MSDQHDQRDVAGLLISIGSINADFQVRTARRPEISETLIATDFLRLGGGKAANVAFLACRLGVSACLLAHVGDDDLAEQALKPLRDIGVDQSKVKAVKQHDTGFAMITVPPDGKKGIVMAANANAHWSKDDARDVAETIRAAPRQSVLVADCEIPVFVLERAMRAARERDIRIIFDPSPADQVTDKLLALADVITPNPGEAKSLTGIDCTDPASALAAGRRLLERGAVAACVKLPDGGCMLVDKEHVVHFGSSPVETVDTTGAGDAFAGALAVAILEEKELVDATRFAVAAAHLAVTRYGSQPAYPGREEIGKMEQRISVGAENGRSVRRD